MWDGDPVDAYVLVTAHDVFLRTDWARYPGAAVVDGRNALDRASIEAAGHAYIGVGR